MKTMNIKINKMYTDVELGYKNGAKIKELDKIQRRKKALARKYDRMVVDFKMRKLLGEKVDKLSVNRMISKTELQECLEGKSKIDSLHALKEKFTAIHTKLSDINLRRHCEKLLALINDTIRDGGKVIDDEDDDMTMKSNRKNGTVMTPRGNLVFFSNDNCVNSTIPTIRMMMHSLYPTRGEHIVLHYGIYEPGTNKPYVLKNTKFHNHKPIGFNLSDIYRELTDYSRKYGKIALKITCGKKLW